MGHDPKTNTDGPTDSFDAGGRVASLGTMSFCGVEMTAECVLDLLPKNPTVITGGIQMG